MSTTSKFLYLAVFLGGLALAVHAMLHGVERWRRRRSLKPSAVLNPPTIAALGLGFGMSGYLLVTRSTLSPFPTLLISLLVGVTALTGMIFLMAKWALRHSEQIHSDEDDTSGQLATVTRTITPDHPGEITWYAWNRTHMLPAIAIGAAEIPEGTEVVIDLIEDGVARVELWSVVERRL